MREAIKMIFFRSVFLFWLISLIYVIKRYIEIKMQNVQKDIDEIYEKKYKEKEKWYELRIKMMEKMCEERMNDWYNIRIKYYDLLEFEICWKSVEERMKDKDKVVYTKNNKSKWKK